MDDNACKHQKMLPYLLVFHVILISATAGSVGLKPGVKLIDPAAVTLYSCHTGDAFDNHTWLLIYPNGTGQVEVNNTISSRQAGGLMHKIYAAQEIGSYLFMLASVAELEDIFEYVNESQETQTIARITRLEAEEFLPDTNLVESLINYAISKESLPGVGEQNFLPEGENVLAFTDQDVWKCAGHRYSDNEENGHVTYYLVIPTNQSQNVTAGDILVGTESRGFLETVTSISQIAEYFFVHSDLLFCGVLEDNAANLTITGVDISDSAMFCQGGDGIPGLHVKNQSAAVSVGDIIAGKPSGEFAAKAIRCNISGIYTICEVTPILEIVNNAVIVGSSDLPTEIGNRVNRESKEYSIVDISKDLAATLGEIELPCGTLTASAAAKFKFSLKISVTTNSSPPFLTNIRTVFDTSLALTLKLRFDFACSLDITGPDSAMLKHPINNVNILPFCIPVARICIPGALLADLTVEYKLTAEAKGFVSVSFERKGSLYAQAEWDYYNDAVNIPPTFELTTTKQNYDGKLESDKSFALAELTITPALKIAIPRETIIGRIIRAVVNFIKWLYYKIFYRKEITVEKKDPIFAFVLSTPLVGRAEAVACPEECQNYPQENVKVTAHAGLPESYNGNLNTRIPLTNVVKKFKLFEVEGKHFDKSKCITCRPFPPCVITTTPSRTTSSIIDGDPHMITFDGAKITYDGTCRYLLTGLCPIYMGDAEHFTLSGRNIQKRRGTYVEDVLLTLYDLRLHLSHEGIVTMDGKELSLPFWNGRINITKTVLASTHALVSKSLLFEPVLRLETASLINITFTVRHPDSDGKHHLRMEIPRKYHGKLCGLAQNFNGDPSDDYRLCDGQDIRHIAPAQIRDQIIAESCRVWDEVDGPSPIC